MATTSPFTAHFLKGEEVLHHLTLPTPCRGSESAPPVADELRQSVDAPPTPIPRCTCFSLCTKIDALRFVREFLPHLVTARDSPWLAYLSAIYPSTSPIDLLPFDMHLLRWFYHNDEWLWPRHVEWPMATCHMKTGRVDANTSGAPCSAAVCNRWRRHASKAGVDKSPPGKPEASSSWDPLRIHGLVLFGTRSGRSRGTLLVAAPSPATGG